GFCESFETVFSFQATPIHPIRNLTAGRDGAYFGVSEAGGEDGCGTVYKIAADGKVEIVTQLKPIGFTPLAGLTRGTDGNYYGTTSYGTNGGPGVIYKLTEEGVLTVLASFDAGGINPGASPRGNLLEGMDGNFYGVTTYGGTNAQGTVYKVTPSGAITSLVSFNDRNRTGVRPSAGLVFGPDGNLYGTTDNDQIPASVFKVTTDGVLTTLHLFNSLDGKGQISALVKGADGYLYGTTFAGGNSDFGTIYKISTNGSLTTLHSFNGQTGKNPSAGLTVGKSGIFYGTTSAGGANGLGVVYKMDPDGVVTTLVSLDNTSGSAPKGELVVTDDQSLIGTCYSGGSAGFGTIFKLYPSGQLTTLHSFQSTNGYYPEAGLVEGSDGNLYGSTENGGLFNQGLLYKMSPSGLLTSYAFPYQGTSPAGLMSPLVEGRDGDFYGTTMFSGTRGLGTIFKLTKEGAATLLYSMGESILSPYYPMSPMLMASDGSFFGTSAGGGNSSGRGTVFNYTPGAPLSIVYSFNGDQGINTQRPLIQSANGDLYSTLFGMGQTPWYGTVFRLTSAGVFTKLSDLPATNGSVSYVTLIQGWDGNFYGTTVGDGAFKCGTVFKMTAQGTVVTLADFNQTNGKEARSPLLHARDGYLYGTTRSGGASDMGTLFRVSTNGTLTTLKSFDLNSGHTPRAGLVQTKSGIIYGATTTGGPRLGGTIFRLKMPTAISVSHEGSRVILSWSTNSPGLTLQSSSDLGDPTTWITSPGNPIITGDQYTVTNNMDYRLMFYRLQQ
ncbi:MAG: 3-carboxymuconate cyclase, partial [Verrucomicrobiales bacterium]|nr:3-carboxymuconate cyclase [Verrucomicrobiales bacterium]